MTISSPMYFGPGDWMDDPSLIERNNGHTYITVTKRKTVEISRSKVNDAQLLPLITSDVSKISSWTLKLIITERAWVSRDVRQIPYPINILEAIMKHWRINEVGFSVHTRAGSCSMPFHPVPGNSSYTGVVLRLVYGIPFRGTLAISHNQNTNTTYAVCFAITPNHAQVLIKRLEASKEYAFFPLHLAYLLTDIALIELEHFSSNTYSDFVHVREAMGTNMYFLPADVSYAPDLSELPRRLTALANASASNCSSLRGIRGIIGTMESVLQPTIKTVGYDPAVVCAFRDRLTLMGEVVENTLRRNEYLKESIQAQVQLVYALVAQKDNEINHQNGADMRIIAIVTLMFLPGTFVATLFSTSFWDFSPANQGAMVSRWVWLYLVVTAILTTCVVGVWMRWPVFRRVWRRSRFLSKSGSAAKVEVGSTT